MRLRRWCVAWDGSPFIIRIDSRHFTRWGAEVRNSMRFGDRCFVTTVDEAKRLDAAVTTRSKNFDLPVINNRFELSQEEDR